MRRLDITQQGIIESEEKSDQYLEKKKKRIQKKARKH
jgi:hypothetical protein